MKSLATVLLFALICTCTFGQDKPTKQKKYPKIKFNEKVHNLGKIYEDKIAKYDFVFYNTGNSPLIIKNATASCNCTVADWHKAPVLPGDSGIITASFDPKGYAGHTFRKTITVFTNARENNKRNMTYGIQVIGRVIKRK